MQKETKKTKQDWYYYKLGIRIAADFGVTLAVPPVIAAFLGKWLDERWGTAPWIFAICLLIAFILTAVIVVRKAKVYGRLYQNGPKQ